MLTEAAMGARHGRPLFALSSHLRAVAKVGATLAAGFAPVEPPSGPTVRTGR